MCPFPGCSGVLGAGLLPSDRAPVGPRDDDPSHPEQGWGRQGAGGGEHPAWRTPQPPAPAISQALATLARAR